MPEIDNLQNAYAQQLIEAELRQILKSKTFARSPRVRPLLDYIISRWLAGGLDGLNGYNLAISVFGRDESFDSSLDPIVRVEVARLRNQLARYYSSEGSNSHLRIDIPKGTYIPVVYEHRPTTQITAIPIYPGWTSVLVIPFLMDTTTRNTVSLSAVSLSDELILVLTQSPDIRVTSRISSIQLVPGEDARQLGKRFGAQYIIEGTMTPQGTEFEVVVHLAETVCGYNIWSARYAVASTVPRHFADQLCSDLIIEIRKASSMRSAAGDQLQPYAY